MDSQNEEMLETHEELLKVAKSIKKRTCCKMALNSQIGGLQMFSFFTFYGIVSLQIAMSSGFMIFILQDPDYYNLSNQDATSQSGYVGSISESSVIFV